MKEFIAVILVMVFFMPVVLTSGDNTTNTIEQESKMKKYNENAQWRYVDCTNCSGTGSVTKYVRDEKTYRSIALRVMCPYCKGSGKSGMSKN